MRILDFIFVLRPTLFFPAWTFALAGYYAASRFAATTGNSYTPAALTLISILYTLLVSAVFLANNLADVKNDAANKKVFLIHEQFIKPSVARIYLILLLVVSLSLAFAMNREIFIWFLLIFFVWGWAYSLPPFAMKDKPLGGIITNSLAGLLLFLFGWWVQAGNDILQALQISIPYILGWTGISLLTTIPDEAGDKADNKVTIAVVHGIERTQDWAYLFVILSLFAAVMTRDWLIGVSGLISLPLHYRMIRSRTPESTLVTIRLGVSFLSFALFVVYPIYFGLCFLTFFGAKWYYLKRFNLNYPTWKVNGHDPHTGE